MTSVGELAQIAIIGPDSGKTVPEKWAALATPTDVSSVMLDFTNASGLVGPTGNQALPHAAVDPRPFHDAEPGRGRRG